MVGWGVMNLSRDSPVPTLHCLCICCAGAAGDVIATARPLDRARGRRRARGGTQRHGDPGSSRGGRRVREAGPLPRRFRGNLGMRIARCGA